MNETVIDENPRIETLVEEPWPYLVIENFLPEGAFNTMRENCMWLFSGYQGLIQSDYDGNVQRYPLKRDFLEEYDMKQYLDRFEHREYSELKIFSNFVKTKANFVHKRHVEAPFKIMSAVLYLAPDANNGTRIYADGDESSRHTKELIWEPNTMLIFAGKDDVTWHDYTSSWNDRYTFNWYLVDPNVIENEEYKSMVF
jgi:hypothetical protein